MANSTYVPQKDQLSTTGVVAGSYTNSNITVNATGQITTISNGTSTGVPAGGTANQVLAKIDGTDYNTQWITSAGSGNMTTAVYDAAAINQQLVGITATQTLTNKTLTSGTNVFPTFNQNTTGTAANVTGVVAFANGGTGATSQTAAINATNPHTTLGDLSYRDVANVQRLAGNTTATKQYLTQTGTGTVSAVPVWAAIAAADVPTLNQNTTGTAANVTGVVTVTNGGTGAATLTGILKGAGTAAITAVAAPTGTIVGTSDAQTLTNKTVDNTNAVTLKAASFTLQDGTDTTKQLRFNLAGITTANTRTFTVPDLSDTLVTLTATQTLTNKTLTSPVIGTIINTGTLTLPTATGTIALTSSNITGTSAAASGLIDATTTVSTASAAAPTSGQVLTATSSTTATWQTPSGGANGISSATANGAVYATGSTTVTSTAALTNGQILIGSTSAVPVAGTITAGTNVAVTNGAGTITVGLTGTVAIANGGTNATTSQAAYNNTSPMTTLGDIMYEDATPQVSRLAGNTTSTKKFLTQTGTGSVSAAPGWNSIVAADVPTLNQNTTGSAGSLLSATTTVSVSSATAPTTGQVLTATGASAATWQTPSGSSSGVNQPLFQLSTYTTGVSLGQQATYILYVAQATQTINKLQFYCTVAQNASVIGVSMYSAALAQLGGGGTVTISATAGLYTASFASGVSVTAGTSYYFAIVNQTNETVTRFAAMNSANDLNVTSVVNSTSALPTTMPSSGSRSSFSSTVYLMPLT